MKMALVTDGIPPFVIGGMQKHSGNLLTHLAAKGVKIDFYHCVPKDVTTDKFTNETLDQRNIRSYIIPFPVADKLPGHYIRNSHKYSNNIYEEYLSHESVDLIYCKGFTALKFIEEKVKGNLLTPLIVNFHGYEMFQLSPDFKSFLEKKLIFQKPVRYILQHADAVMSYGGKITNLLQSESVSDDRIVEIPGGIDKEWIRPNVKGPSTPRRFVFIGRFERRKGIELLQNALKLMANQEYEMIFIGPIPKEKQVNLKQVQYLGEVNDKMRIQNELTNADVLVCPSYSEGMPNVILEAMASGCAIIATDVGAVSTCVNESHGMVIHPGNLDELVNAMRKFISMPAAELEKMKIQSQTRIRESFTWDKIVDQHISAFQKIMNQSKIKS